MESAVGGLSPGIGTGGNPRGASIATGVPTTCAGDEQDARNRAATSGSGFTFSKYQQILLGFDLLKINPLHLPQIVDRFKIAVLGAIFNMARASDRFSSSRDSRSTA